MPPRKTPKNTSKARRKKSIMRLPSSLKQLMHSSIILFLVFVVVLMDLMSLWKSNDNESLFLFIFIALLTYTQNQNMIVVLGVPLIIVNVLRMMKKSLNHEGFDDEKLNPYKFQEFAKDYFENNREYEETGTEYGIVNEEEDDYILSEIVNKFIDGPKMEDEEDEDEDNKDTVMTLISYISYIDGISKDDVSDFDEEQKSQYDYVKNMINKFKSDKKKKDDKKKDDKKKKKKEDEEVSLDDITMEDDEIPIEGDEENFDNKKKDKKKDLADITKSLQNISDMLGSS